MTTQQDDAWHRLDAEIIARRALLRAEASLRSALEAAAPDDLPRDVSAALQRCQQSAADLAAAKEAR